MWKNKESYVDYGGVFGLSIIKHVTLQKIVAHDFRYDPRIIIFWTMLHNRLLISWKRGGGGVAVKEQETFTFQRDLTFGSGFPNDTNSTSFPIQLGIL